MSVDILWQYNCVNIYDILWFCCFSAVSFKKIQFYLWNRFLSKALKAIISSKLSEWYSVNLKDIQR